MRAGASIATPSAQRILLVEDDPGTAELMRRSLARAGYAVEIAPGVQSGLTALKSCAGNGFQALLLDYRLPDGEPWELADAALACVPEVPVVIVTAMSNETVAIEAVRRGFADYVKKTEGFWNELPAVLERVARLSRIKGRLDETSALMRAIVEQSSDLVAVCTWEGKLVYVSPVCGILLGMHCEDLVGRQWSEMVIPEDREALRTMLRGLDKPEVQPAPPATVRCPRTDGSFAWMESRAALLRGPSCFEPMIVLTLHDVTAQREHEERMRAALLEKEVLLREVHHRVKNNLQVIQSLLKIRARTLRAGETRQAIEATVERVRAMSLVHEHLYRMEDVATLSLSNYLRELFQGVVASRLVASDQIQLSLDVEEILPSLDRAVPFALLANELLSNCLKHGFPDGRTGTIAISLQRTGGAVRLIVQDDGVGLPENFNAAACNSMGLKLAASLAHQLGGKLEFVSEKGCRAQADLTRL
jgi:PAS domain S-box-containing protein